LNKLDNLVYVSVIYPEKNSETSALLLAESIRAFAGKLANNPIWFYTPKTGEIDAGTNARLAELSVELISYKPVSDDFFFLNDAKAAKSAENKALKKSEQVAWMSSNSLILQEPRDYLLDSTKKLGYMPVHHTLVGSKINEPLNDFWRQIYDYCKVESEKVFPMKTHIDGQSIRPYFNAGFLIIRPKQKLMSRWFEKFKEAYNSPIFKKFYDIDKRYIIFLHQAVLSGVILACNRIDELKELPNLYNYPIHLYDVDNSKDRPSKIDELVTIRHEGFYNDPHWETKIPVSYFLKKWLKDHIKN